MRHVFPFSISLALAGCATAPAAWQAGDGLYHFDWRLSGDAAVAPLQVFDSPEGIWLQFPAGQAIPAIFGLGAQGEQLLAYQRRDPYVLLPPGWSQLVLRGGRRQAYAQRQRGPGDAPARLPAPLADATSSGQAPALAEAPVASSVAADSVQAVPSVSAPPAPVASSPHRPASAASPRFFAGPPDTTLRAVLSRWARQAGWVFGAEHWLPTVDIPLQGQAGFDGDFKVAVRQLLRATELGDRPLQPCFYANRVLRVLPLAQSCDRSVAGPA
ncbi:type IV pilus assembly protein [Bordetella trematum]|uniref:TcpQ domain-containing protein n=1 Tax=Bordetella trematum TaxID=123899 RepID=UPI000792277F|nr:TcpQ domain-containing protein [Bordetella trematum]SAI41449.1 type IV pilus assembly protein [Bordetella trematum]